VVFGFSLAPGVLMEAFLVSTGVVALGEMGDKTQLLAFLLASCRAAPSWLCKWGWNRLQRA